MPTLNKAIIIGHLGKDAEVRTTQSGTEIASFSIATVDRLKKNGEWMEVTDWHNIKSFVSTKYIADYAKKGACVYVEGKFKNDKYTDKNGVEKTFPVIVADKVMIWPKTSVDTRQQEPDHKTFDEMNDEIPF